LERIGKIGSLWEIIHWETTPSILSNSPPVIICFILRYARQVFETQFASNPLTAVEEQIIKESEAQVKLAEADLNDIDQVDVKTVKGHLLTLVLLKKSVQFVEQLSRQNLIPEAAASVLLEKLDRYIENVSLCDKLDMDHNERLSTTTMIVRLRQLPRNIIEEFNIRVAIDEMSRTTFGRAQVRPKRSNSTNLSVNNNRAGGADSDQHTPTLTRTEIPIGGPPGSKLPVIMSPGIVGDDDLPSNSKENEIVPRRRTEQENDTLAAIFREEKNDRKGGNQN
jgi:hypothetical protein